MDFDDARRLKALQDYRVLDTPIEESFDNLVQLTSKIFRAPIALVSLVDQDRQWFKARIGLEPRETPRAVSFCDHAIRANTTLVVPDATRDERFMSNSLVTGSPGIRFYCGVPLRTVEGEGMGTLCVIDREPRTISPADIATLEALGRQVEIELEIRRRFGLLEEALATQDGRQRSKELMASMLVHDIRSPLTSILMLASFIQAADEVSRKNLMDLLEEVQRVRRMLTDVLDLCIHDVGDLHLRRMRFSFPPLAEKVAQRMVRMARSRNQALELELEDAPLMVNADPELLERVLDNLLANAIHHGPSNEPITLAVHAIGNGSVRVEIRDRGNTIPPDRRGSIFQPFDHLQVASEPVHRGYGLGLAFCLLAIGAHGGEIGVSPNEGLGNCFHFEIPSAL